MKRYLSLIVIIFFVVISLFGVKNLYQELNMCGVEINSFCSEGDSEIVYLDANQVDNLLDSLNVEIHSKKDIAGRTIIEGYSQKLEKFIISNNLKTNIQIAIEGEEAIVGYPLISGSF